MSPPTKDEMPLPDYSQQVKKQVEDNQVQETQEIVSQLDLFLISLEQRVANLEATLLRIRGAI